MALMYTIKAVKRDGERYCHPCEGAYRVIWNDQSSSEDPGFATVHDVEKGVHFSTTEFQAIYIENAEGQTIDSFKAPVRVNGGVGSAGVQA